MRIFDYFRNTKKESASIAKERQTTHQRDKRTCIHLMTLNSSSVHRRPRPEEPHETVPSSLWVYHESFDAQSMRE